MSRRLPSATLDPAASIRTLLPVLLLVGAVLVIAQTVKVARFESLLAFAAAAAIFIVVFLRTEFGIHLVVLSMLLSPEFGGGGGLAEGRNVVFRTEDFLLMIIAASWFAKTAVNKEMGLVLKTPLNRPIVLYIAATVIPTILGYMVGTVRSAAGFFYVLKYVEYFFVYYMVVNNVTARPQIRRVVGVAVVTAAIVSLIGIGQIPSGERVSAPFEGKDGEPNTLGGYLLLMMALLVGVALETRSLRRRVACLALTGLLSVPFLFTLSRASYLGLVPVALVLTFLSRRRRMMVTVLAFGLLLSPLAVSMLPTAVVNRVLYTFQPEKGEPTVKVGQVAFDPSTSARFLSIRQAFEGWAQRPILGYGVTGFGFMDAQYARTLVETGLVGMAAFLWLAFCVLRSGLSTFHELRDPNERGLALGFIAGTVGLLVHAVGSNTFIIVRIMEPFWLFAGVVMMLPILQRTEEAPVGVARRPGPPWAPRTPMAPGTR